MKNIIYLLFISITCSCCAQVKKSEIENFLINEGYRWEYIETDVAYFTPPPPTWFQFYFNNDSMFSLKITGGPFSEEILVNELIKIKILSPFDVIIQTVHKNFYLIFSLNKPDEIILRSKGNSPEIPTIDILLYNERRHNK